MIYKYTMQDIILLIMFAVAVVAVVKIWGIRNVADYIAKKLDMANGKYNMRGQYDLSPEEAKDFAKILKPLVGTVTFMGSTCTSNGWRVLNYMISRQPEEDLVPIKKAVCIELHNYFLDNHGVNFECFYVPTFTENAIVIKIASSEKAEEEYAQLQFDPVRLPDNRSMRDD